MTRADAIARAQQHFASGEFLKILDRRVGFRTESQQKNSGAALRAYLVEELQPAFAALQGVEAIKKLPEFPHWVRSVRGRIVFANADLRYEVWKNCRSTTR